MGLFGWIMEADRFEGIEVTCKYLRTGEETRNVKKSLSETIDIGMARVQ